MVDNSSQFPVHDYRFWQLGPQLREEFDEHRRWAEQTLRGLDPATRQGVFETEAVYNYGEAALGHVAGDHAHGVAAMSGRQAAIQIAMRTVMRTDSSVLHPGNPFRKYADLPKPGHPRDIGPGATWWEKQRYDAYRSGQRSMLEDVAKLNQPELRQLLSDIGSSGPGSRALLDADMRLREAFGGFDDRGAGGPLASVWVDGRQDALAHWRTEYRSDQLAASAALDGQLAPGSPAPSAGHGTGPASGTGSAAETGAAADARPARTAPTAANAAGHRYPSTGTNRDQRGR